MIRMVNCIKLGRELPGLDAPPFPGELGQRIYEEVSARAYAMWPAQATILINHYGLNLADPAARQFLLESRIHLLLPLARFAAEQMRPAHLPGDDFVALRMVHVFLDQIHVFLRAPFLLLEKAFPVVFVPNIVGVVFRHVR